jgi:hypothetical protein
MPSLSTAVPSTADSAQPTTPTHEGGGFPIILRNNDQPFAEVPLFDIYQPSHGAPDYESILQEILGAQPVLKQIGKRKVHYSKVTGQYGEFPTVESVRTRAFRRNALTSEEFKKIREPPREGYITANVAPPHQRSEELHMHAYGASLSDLNAH